MFFKFARETWRHFLKPRDGTFRHLGFWTRSYWIRRENYVRCQLECLSCWLLLWSKRPLRCKRLKGVVWNTICWDRCGKGWFGFRQETDNHVCDQRFNYAAGDEYLGNLTCFRSRGSASKEKDIKVFPKDERASGSTRQDDFWVVKGQCSVDLMPEG